MNNNDNMLRVGTFVNTHGIRGEIKVYPHTDDMYRFKELDYFYLDTRKELIHFEVSNARFFKNMVILKMKGIDNINDIEKYKGNHPVDGFYEKRKQFYTKDNEETKGLNSRNKSSFFIIFSSSYSFVLLLPLLHHYKLKSR